MHAIWECMCVCVFIWICVYVFMYVWVCTCVRVWMHTCVCLCVSVCGVTFMMLPRDVWALRISQLTKYNSSTYPLTFSREGGNPPFHSLGLVKGFQRRSKLPSNYLVMHPDVLWLCSFAIELKRNEKQRPHPLLHSRIVQTPPIRGTHICPSIRLFVFIKPRRVVVLSVLISGSNVHSYCEGVGISLSPGQCTGSIMSLHPTCHDHRMHPVPALGGPFIGWSNRVKH